MWLKKNCQEGQIQGGKTTGGNTHKRGLHPSTLICLHTGKNQRAKNQQVPENIGQESLKETISERTNFWIQQGIRWYDLTPKKTKHFIIF